MSSGPAILGRTLAGRFRVTAFIGEGAMASVYRGVQEAEPRDVALKIMHPHLVHDEVFVGRFRREAKAAARIVHPHSVRIVDTGVDGDLLYIAMELLSGQDLFETLVLERRLAPARAVRILVQVADALAAAHDKGVVHRDLKPENIMLLRDGGDPSREEVKVLDFGIAKILESDTPSVDGPPSMHSALTGVGTVVGTPAYMSPEQCRGEPVDSRSDIYACGVLLYQLVAGKLPFTSENAMDLAVMHVRTPPPPLEEVVPAIDRRLAAIVLRALSKWPSQRQQTAAELRDALAAILPEMSPRPLQPAGQTAPPAAAPPPVSKEATTLPPEDDPAEHAPTVDQAAAGGTSISTAPAAAPAPSPAKAKKPAPMPNPVSAALRVHRPAGAVKRRSGLLASWMIVPLALLIGIGLGAIAFFLLGH